VLARCAQAAYGAAAVDAAADVNVTLWRNGVAASPGIALTKAKLRARRHGGKLLPVVQEALDEAVVKQRVMPPAGGSKSACMHACMCSRALLCAYHALLTAEHARGRAAAKRVYGLDGQQVTAVEQLQPNGNYMCARVALMHARALRVSVRMCLTEERPRRLAACAAPSR
jgi:hypothetical protein